MVVGNPVGECLVVEYDLIKGRPFWRVQRGHELVSDARAANLLPVPLVAFPAPEAPLRLRNCPICPNRIE